MIWFLLIPLILWMVIMTVLFTPKGTYSSFLDRLTRARYRNDCMQQAFEQVSKQSASDEISLVLELLKRDDWTKAGNNWKHSTGVIVSCNSGFTTSRGVYYTIAVYIKDEQGTYQSADTTDAEDKLLESAIEAFKTRAANNRKRELAKALAERVIAFENGTLPPVLGESGADGLPDAGKTDERITATGFLSYNSTTQRVVSPVSEPTEQIKLDDALRRRYGVGSESLALGRPIPPKKQTMSQ